jgi:hypothetical protein
MSELPIVEKLREPHYISDEDHAHTPDRVLELIQETLRPERNEAAALIEELVGALEQLLDDMGEDGLCVCQQAKDEAAVILAKVRQ